MRNLRLRKTHIKNMLEALYPGIPGYTRFLIEGSGRLLSINFKPFAHEALASGKAAFPSLTVWPQTPQLVPFTERSLCKNSRPLTSGITPVYRVAPL